MNKLALVGKDISHSRSPEMYKKLISPNVQYTLLDFQKPEDIPSAKELLSVYDGINITSPYKRHFLNQVTLTESALKTNAINCLKNQNGVLIGENTDYLAILDILEKFKKSFGKLDAIVLGDGVMSEVVQVALKNLNIKFRVLSRKLTHQFDQLNLESSFTDIECRPLIINTCARTYIFRGKAPSNSIFWDFNYNFREQETEVSSKVEKYFDGLEMLERQAFYAVAFWSTKSQF